MEELDIRIAVCELALQWLRSDDPMLKEPGNAALIPAAIEEYTRQLNELKRRKVPPVKVGLGTAKITPKVLGG